ncbi:MAG: hypothetical protein IT285_01245 [Bdellovibrionales bacterium]|nr:hypothetical protein [Bdellovibrionales bacterium]
MMATPWNRNPETSPRPWRRVALATLATLATVSSSATSFADHGAPGSFPNPNPILPPQQDYLEQPLNQYLVGSNTLDVLQLLNLNWSSQGRRVEYVVLRARSDAGAAQAQLVANFTQTGLSQNISTWTQALTFLPPTGADTLGSTLRDLAIQTRGRVTVEAIGVKLAPAWNPGPGPGPGPGHEERVTREIQARYQGQNTLQLRELIGLGPQFNGRRLRAILVQGSTAAGNGRLQLLINQQPVGWEETVEQWSNETRIDLNQVHAGQAVLGQDIRSLQLNLRGNFFIERITAVLERTVGPGPGPGPGPNPNQERIHQRIDRTFANGAVLPLRQLLNLGAQHNGKRVAAVLLEARALSHSASASARVNNLASGLATPLGNWAQTVSLQLPAAANVLGQDLRELAIELRGSVAVESITVVLERAFGPGPGPGPHPNPGVLRAEVQRQLTGPQTTYLADLLPQLAQLPWNVRVGRVTLIARTAGGNGTAALCGATACSGAQSVPQQLVRTVFDANQVGAHDARQLRIETRGNFWVDAVEVEVRQ